MKFSIDDIKKQFDNRGYILLSKEYINQKQYMEFICKKHENKGTQKIKYANFKYKNNGCHFCAKEKRQKEQRYSIEHIKELVENKGLEFVDILYFTDTHRTSSIIKFICPKHRYVGVQQATLYQIKNGLHGCNYCNYVLDTYTFKEKLKKNNINIEFIGEYFGQDVKMEFICPKHQTHFMEKPRKIFEHVNGCPDCKKEFLINNQLLTKEQAQEKLSKLFPSLHIIGEYTNTFLPVEIYCDIHKYNFMCAINNYLYKGKVSCCPKDISYQGEKSICEFLDKNGYRYSTQKSFDNLLGIHNGKLSYDFYLDDHNTYIEFNGEQHYHPIEHFGGEKRYKKQVIHDNLKKDYCIKNNINLIIVPYWEKGNIDCFLRNELKKII